MNVSPIRQSPMPERHVHFSDHIEVKIIEPRESAPIQPSLYAQQLERQLRIAPNVTPQSRPAQPTPRLDRCKDVLHKAAMICGALVLPSFACLALGPFGLIAPAALFALSVVFYLLGGKQTERMQQECEMRRAEARRFDSQCS